MKKKLITFLLLLPAILSLLVLAAHFLRSGHLLIVLFCLILPFTLIFKHPVCAKLTQITLLLGTLEWLRTMYHFVSERMLTGEPWKRLAIILSSVALVTLISGILFFLKPLKERYKAQPQSETD